MLRSLSRLLVLALALTGPSVAGDVIVVREDGTGDFVDLPAAVAAAQDGDLLLVGDGHYSAFDLEDRELAIVAEDGATPRLWGNVEVRSLFRGRTTLLSGLHFEAGTAANPRPRVLVLRCRGAVRVDSCTIVGLDREYWCGGGDALRARHSQDVAITRSVLQGGVGSSAPGYCYSSTGGRGLLANDSSVASWRSLYYGGKGGWGQSIDLATAGGDGCRLTWDARLYSFHNLFQGGEGGDDATAGPGSCGKGGAGLLGRPGTEAWDQESVFAGGAGGVDIDMGSSCDDGVGLDMDPDDFHELDGQPPALDAPRIVVAGELFDLDAFGPAGSLAYVAVSSNTGVELAAELRGAWYVELPFEVPLVPLGIIDGAGALGVSLRAPRLPVGEQGEVLYLQLFLDTPNGPRLGSPVPLVVLAP